MNFADMPELKIAGAYHFLLGVMVCMVVLQLWIFRRKKWI